MIAHLFPRLCDQRLQAVSLHDGNIFFFCPSLLLDVRIEVIVPSFSTLFPYSAMQILSDKRPILGTILHHHLPNYLVFFRSPWPFYKNWIKYLLPSVEALNIGPILEERGDFFPITCLGQQMLPRICLLIR